MDERCYICRKPAPRELRRARSGGWRHIRIASMPFAALCGGCSARPGRRSEQPASETFKRAGGLVEGGIHKEMGTSRRMPSGPRIRLSDTYPIAVRGALYKLVSAARGCGEAVEYVLRIDREAIERFRPMVNCVPESVDRWLAQQPNRLAHIKKIKEHARSDRRKPEGLNCDRNENGRSMD